MWCQSRGHTVGAGWGQLSSHALCDGCAHSRLLPRACGEIPAGDEEKWGNPWSSKESICREGHLGNPCPLFTHRSGRSHGPHLKSSESEEDLPGTRLLHDPSRSGTSPAPPQLCMQNVKKDSAPAGKNLDLRVHLTPPRLAVLNLSLCKGGFFAAPFS